MAREGGYTLIETGMAMAVSAALFLLTIGLSTMVSNQRFRDSITTAQSFIQTQYNEVRSGINSRLGGSSNIPGCKNNGSAAMDDGCYIVGRLLTFSGETVRSSYVVASAGSNWPDSEKSSVENLANARLYVVSSSGDAGLDPTEKQLAGNEIKWVWYVDDADANNPSVSKMGNPNLAILRSPLDGSLVVSANVRTGNVSGRTDLQTLYLNEKVADGTANMPAEHKIAIAVKNGGAGYSGGLICIAGGDNSVGVSSNYNANLASWSDEGLNSSADGRKRINNACSNWE